MRIDILGTGPSLLHYEKKTGAPSMGVNDIYRHVPTDFVVVVDKPERFIANGKQDAVKIIQDCRPQKLFTHIEAWQFHPCYERIEMQDARHIINLASEKISYSNNSIIPAIHIAYLRGYKDVTLWGVDLRNHPAFENKEMLKGAVNDFKEMERQLKLAGGSLKLGSGFSVLSNFLPVASY